MIPWRDVRCMNEGRTAGRRCMQLLLRVTADTRGHIEMKCPRCKQYKTLRIEVPAAVAST